MKTPTQRCALGAWFTVVLLLPCVAHAQAAPPVQWNRIVADMPSGDVTFPAGDAVGQVAKARGMSAMAESTGLGRESLYKALTPGAKPRYDTMLKVLQGLGVKLKITAA